jgi:uncharacterized protein YndB with AHSA1/START domain
MLPARPRGTLEGRKEKVMVHIRTSIVIRRPQQETFDYLTDLRNAKEWATELVDVAYDGDLRVGATGVDTRRRGSKEFLLPWTVTEYKRPERLVLEFGPPFPASAEFTFRPEPGGTRFTCDTNLRPRGLWRLLTPMLAAEIRHIDGPQFQKAKEILESRSATVDANQEEART